MATYKIQIDNEVRNATTDEGAAIEAAHAEDCARTLRAAGEQVYVIGNIVEQGVSAQVVVA